MKTAQQAVDDANALAGKFYNILGFVVPDKFKFYKTQSVRARQVWYLACEAYSHIAGEVKDNTEPEESEG